MSGRNDGGPAYPVPEIQLNEAGCFPVANPGMTLRDYFAGQVSSTLLDGYITAICSKGEGLADQAMAMAAKASYMFADAMLAEREKGDSE